MVGCQGDTVAFILMKEPILQSVVRGPNMFLPRDPETHVVTDASESSCKRLLSSIALQDLDIKITSRRVRR